MSNITPVAPLPHFIDNLSNVILNNNLANHSQVILDESTFTTFTQLVKYANSVLESQNLETIFSSDNYLPGRLSTYLERIAELKFNISLENVYKSLEMMELEDRLLSVLKKILPTSTKFQSNPETQNSSFYQEGQEKLESCQIHAINALMGSSVLKVSECEKISFTNFPNSTFFETDPDGFINTDKLGFPFDPLPKLVKHMITEKQFSSFFTDEGYNSLSRFSASNGSHAFTFCKDPEGQWWKVDSLYKAGRHLYQTPVDFSLEQKSIISVQLLMEENELKDLMKEHLNDMYKTISSSKIPFQKNEKTLEELKDFAQQFIDICFLIKDFKIKKYSTYFIKDSILEKKWDSLLLKIDSLTTELVNALFCFSKALVLTDKDKQTILTLCTQLEEKIEIMNKELSTNVTIS